jgi:Cof subfamily protein (haloacid dehalogenase superfamily)
VARVRLLAIDLDFTLLDRNRRIPLENIEAIQIARKAGIEVVLASGRVASGMTQYADELDLRSALISCNGAFVVTRSMEVIAERRLSEEHTRKALEFFSSKGVHAHVYRSEEILMAELNRWTEIYLDRVKRANYRIVDRHELHSGGTHKVIAMADPDEADRLAEELRQSFASMPVSVVRSEPEYLEVISGDCDKGTGLAAVAGQIGVGQHETAAIGDFHNDIPMLRWAKTSAAVGNAPDEVKQAANMVVAPYDSGGVSEFVGYLVHNSEQSKPLGVRQ